MKKSTLFKWLIVLIIVLGAVYFGRQMWRERQLAQKENAAIQKFNAEEYRSAIKSYKALLEELPQESTPRRERVNHQLALSYKNLADNPKLPIFRSIEYYQQAAAFDQSVIEGNQLEKLLEYGASGMKIPAPEMSSPNTSAE
ncbi:MAG: hypothetical protein R6V56_04195 [Lentisphaeria bacterium]